jgi:hypothetical protein
MGLFGGSSSSSSNTSNVDQRLLQESGAIGATASGGGSAYVTVNQLDGGAIKESFGLGNHAIDSMQGLATSELSAAHHTAELALSGALSSVEDTKEAFDRATEKVATAYADAKVGDRNQFMMLGVVAVVVLGLAIANKGARA